MEIRNYNFNSSGFCRTFNEYKANSLGKQFHKYTIFWGGDIPQKSGFSFLGGDYLYAAPVPPDFPYYESFLLLKIRPVDVTSTPLVVKGLAITARGHCFTNISFFGNYTAPRLTSSHNVSVLSFT